MDTSNVRKEILERKKEKKKMSKAQLQLAIIKKRQCDTKALIIVEQLLEPKIDSQWLLSNLKYINKSHMEDVIEERAIIKLCGYVLCNNVLTATIDQRYHISTKKNKVYDVTKRKNFCSSRCYGACNYLFEQMLTSPLWLRDKEEIPEFKILPAEDELEKSMPGDEIYVNDINIVLNHDHNDEHIETDITCKNTKNACFYTDLKVNFECTEENSQVCNESIQITNSIKKSDVLKEQFLTKFNKEYEDVKNKSTTIKKYINDNFIKKESSLEDNSLLDYTVIQDTSNLDSDIVSLNKDTDQSMKNEEHLRLLNSIKSEHNIINTKQNIVIGNKDYVEKAEQNKSKQHIEKTVTEEKQLKEFYNLAMHVEHSVNEWITEDTICLLLGEEDIKNQLLKNIIQHDKYLHLCKRLNKLHLEDEKGDYTDSTSNTLKPLPHLSALQEEGKKMELKVRAFYKGSMIAENPKSIAEDTGQSNDFTPVLPLTDGHAPKMLRRRIFLDKLNKILPDLLRALASNKLPQYEYNSEKSTLIKALVSTFSLSAGNIIFKMAEWTLVGLIIIKMLSMIDPQLKIVLSTKQASMYISMILMSYKLDSSYLNTLLVELISSRKY